MAGIKENAVQQLLFSLTPPLPSKVITMKPSNPETIEGILDDLFAVLNTSHDRLHQLGVVMPAIYLKAAVQIVGPADIEASHAAARLVEELQRQGIVTKDRTFSRVSKPGKGQA